jgi:hypothetical protein
MRSQGDALLGTLAAHSVPGLQVFLKWLLQLCDRLATLWFHRQGENQMIREAELLERAVTYREMARAALNLKLRIEFNERAQRYEIAALAIKRRQAAIPKQVQSRAQPRETFRPDPTT